MGDQESMRKDDLKNYIRYLANLRIKQLGWKPLYEEMSNPLPWMDWVLSGKKHTNFFEERVTDYSHDPLKGSVDYNSYLLQIKSDEQPKAKVKPNGVLKVYSAGWCSYCNKLKDFLDENFIHYMSVDVDQLDSFELKTIPQVFDGDEHIGGYTETVEKYS